MVRLIRIRAAGFITYNGPVGGWVLSISSGLGTPGAGTLSAPFNGTWPQRICPPAPASLIAQLSGTGFIPFNNETYIATITGGHGWHSDLQKLFATPANVLFRQHLDLPGRFPPSPQRDGPRC